jgi:hypothetical protein
MSIAVELRDLAAAIERYGPTAYLLTGGEDGRPHISHVPVSLGADGDQPVLSVPAGGRTVRNATARPLLALLWPPVEPDGFSLIVDATAPADVDPATDTLVLAPTGGVLPRPAAAGGSDCRPVPLS